MFAAAITRSEVDGEIEVRDGVPADRLVRVKRTPGLPVSASQNVSIQSVDRLAVAQTNDAVTDSRYAVVHLLPRDSAVDRHYQRASQARLDLWRQALVPARRPWKARCGDGVCQNAPMFRDGPLTRRPPE